MDIRDAFEESLEELGIEGLDGTLEDILDEPVEKTEDTELEDEASESEESEEPGDDEQDADSDNDDSADIEIPAGAKVKLPDGTVVNVDKAVLMQADYTRKTQELSDQRKAFEAEAQKFETQRAEIEGLYGQMRDWYESRASQPSTWIMEIAAESGDPTSTVAKAIYELAQAGVLDQQFVETFGIESGPVAQMAGDSRVKDEIAELRAWKEQQEQQVQQRSAVQQRAAQYEQQWQQIKLERGLDFDSQLSEIDAKRELFEFAIQSKMTRSLLDAYDIMTVRKPKKAPVQGSSPEVTAKKRASRAVTAKSASTGTGQNPKKGLSTQEAILQSMDELFAGA